MTSFYPRWGHLSSKLNNDYLPHIVMVFNQEQDAGTEQRQNKARENASKSLQQSNAQ